MLRVEGEMRSTKAGGAHEERVRGQRKVHHTLKLLPRSNEVADANETSALLRTAVKHTTPMDNESDTRTRPAAGIAGELDDLSPTLWSSKLFKVPMWSDRGEVPPSHPWRDLI